MKRSVPRVIVTAVIIGLTLFFAGLSVFTLLQRNRPATAQQSPVVQGGGPAQGAARQGNGPQGQQGPAQGAARQGDGPQGQQGATGQQGAARQNGSGRSATTVRVTPVTRDTIENSVIINGDVMAVNQVSILPTVAGRITRTFYQVGDTVNQGAVVAMVDPSRPGQVYSESPVVSTISGTILSMPVHRGDTVTASTAVVVVGDLSSLLIETFVPERFSNAAQRGLAAQVFLEAFPGESFQAAVAEVSPVLDPASRTLRIRLRFSGATDPRIKAGMFATVTLVTNTRRDVPVIPRTAVINTYGSWIVFAVNDRNIASRREIALGLENELFVEVISGLEVGEMIVSAGQNFLTDGDLVRIVE